MTIRTNILLALAALTTSGAVLATPVTYCYSGSPDQFNASGGVAGSTGAGGGGGSFVIDESGGLPDTIRRHGRR